jgi:hydrogenase nickel incorporation protein HypA/HybF
VHELSLSSAVVATAVKHARGRRVKVVNLRVGGLRQVVPSSLEFYFEFVARDTACEGAKLNQELIESRLGCGPCDTSWEMDLPAFRCPSCGGSEVTVLSGNEFEVESIEIEEEVPCIAPR